MRLHYPYPNPSRHPFIEFELKWMENEEDICNHIIILRAKARGRRNFFP